jgi:hypothetical protein
MKGISLNPSKNRARVDLQSDFLWPLENRAQADLRADAARRAPKNWSRADQRAELAWVFLHFPELRKSPLDFEKYITAAFSDEEANDLIEVLNKKKKTRRRTFRRRKKSTSSIYPFLA